MLIAHPEGTAFNPLLVQLVFDDHPPEGYVAVDFSEGYDKLNALLVESAVQSNLNGVNQVELLSDLEARTVNSLESLNDTTFQPESQGDVSLETDSDSTASDPIQAEIPLEEGVSNEEEGSLPKVDFTKSSSTTQKAKTK